jgi:hypothetical protein
MTNTDTDLADLDPTEADLLAAEADEDEDEVTSSDDFDLDFDSNYEDDRYGEGRNGMPSWSLFA